MTNWQPETLLHVAPQESTSSVSKVCIASVPIMPEGVPTTLHCPLHAEGALVEGVADADTDDTVGLELESRIRLLDDTIVDADGRSEADINDERALDEVGSVKVDIDDTVVVELGRKIGLVDEMVVDVDEVSTDDVQDEMGLDEVKSVEVDVGTELELDDTSRLDVGETTGAELDGSGQTGAKQLASEVTYLEGAPLEAFGTSGRSAASGPG